MRVDEAGPLGHDHQPVGPLGGHPLLQLRCHDLEIAGDLGHEHGIGSDGDAGLHRHPARLLAQDLHDADLARRPGRLTNPVEQLDREAQRAVEPERHHGGRNLVLDRTWHAHRLEPLAVELVEDAHALAADDGDHRIDPLRLEPLQQLVGEVGLLDHPVFAHLADVERIDPGRLAQEAGARRVHVLDPIPAEGQQPTVGVALRVKHSVEAVPDADRLPAQLARSQSRAPDDGVDPRHVAGPHHDGDAPGGTALPTSRDIVNSLFRGSHWLPRWSPNLPSRGTRQRTAGTA